DQAPGFLRDGGYRPALADPDAPDGDALARAVEFGHRVSHPAVVRRTSLLGYRSGQALCRSGVRGDGGVQRAGGAFLQPPRRPFGLPTDPHTCLLRRRPLLPAASI